MDRIRIPGSTPLRLESLGVSPATLLRQARLPQNLLQQERLTVTTAQWFALWNALRVLNDDPELGLRFGVSMRVEQYDPLTIASLCARTFYEALRNVARYKRQFCSEELCVVERDGAWHIEAVWNAAREPAPDVLIDSMFASFVALGQRGSGLDLYPERVMFRRAPIHRAMYENHFHCPVEFDAERNTLVFSHQAIETPFRTFNPEMLALLIPHLESLLQDATQSAQQPISDQVKDLLRKRLPNHNMTMQDVARELNISTRTLQRQLATDGTTFQQVLDSTRRELAEHYLRGSSLDLNEIAYLLGYEEASSFHRAFHHWKGTSPGQWRATNQYADMQR
jgi:AraC-like DNA-binding protein